MNSSIDQQLYFPCEELKFLRVCCDSTCACDSIPYPRRLRDKTLKRLNRTGKTGMFKEQEWLDNLTFASTSLVLPTFFFSWQHFRKPGAKSQKPTQCRKCKTKGEHFSTDAKCMTCDTNSHVYKFKLVSGVGNHSKMFSNRSYYPCPCGCWRTILKLYLPSN